MWRNGVYDYLHYHATVHEALGVARGHARVWFGGDRGREIEISAGDVRILPAGNRQSMPVREPGFCVIGAYPPDPQCMSRLPTLENHADALQTIPAVKLPKTDPVMGADGSAGEIVEAAVEQHKGKPYRTDPIEDGREKTYNAGVVGKCSSTCRTFPSEAIHGSSRQVSISRRQDRRRRRAHWYARAFPDNGDLSLNDALGNRSNFLRE